MALALIEEDIMTTYDQGSAMHTTPMSAPPRWACVLLGIFMILTGLLVLGDIAFFTVISAIFIGWMAIAAGAFEIFHAFWTKGWGGMIWQLILGILYVAFGLILVTQPLTGALLLTYLLGIALLVSGVVRMLIGFGRLRQGGWIMVASGAFGVVAGLIIITGFPATGLWVLGLLLGIDLLSHGIGWLTYAWMPTARPA
jgi:uncharacterized membrane protein HdeD (DUF308 family)